MGREGENNRETPCIKTYLFVFSYLYYYVQYCFKFSLKFSILTQIPTLYRACCSKLHYTIKCLYCPQVFLQAHYFYFPGQWYNNRLGLSRMKNKELTQATHFLKWSTYFLHLTIHTTQACVLSVRTQPASSKQLYKKD